MFKFPLIFFILSSPLVSADVRRVVSLKAFDHLYKVATNRRCTNCHSVKPYPIQGDGDVFIPHRMNVTHKIEHLGHKCTSCHMNSSLPGRNMPPGAEFPMNFLANESNCSDPEAQPTKALSYPDNFHGWRMPPKEMAITSNTSPRQLCLIWKKFESESGITLKEHLGHDPLVHWTWNPGGGRSKSPGTLKQFLCKVREWYDNGAYCPGDKP